MYSSTQSTQADNQVQRYMYYSVNPTLPVVSILVTMAPKLLELATWLVKKVSLNQKSGLPNGDEAETFTWRVETKCESKQTDKGYLFYQKSDTC